MPLSTFICAVILASQQERLEQHVTFTSPAANADTVLAALSKEAGISLTVYGPLSKEILVVRLIDVPVGDVLKNIASATTAHWQSTKDGYRLIRSSADLEPITKAHYNERLKQLRLIVTQASKLATEAGPLTQDKAVTALRATLEHVPEERDEEDYEARQLRDARESLATNAEARGLLRMVEGVGVERLAALCDGGKDFVLATNPTKLQKALDIDPEIWKPYIAEHNATTLASREAFPVEVDPDRMFVSFNRRGLLPPNDDILKAPAAKVILSFTPRLGSDPCLFVDGSFYDSAGHCMVSSRLALMELVKSPTPAASEPRAKPEPRLELSPQALEMAKMLDYQLRESDEARPSPELRSKMLRPDLFEPLGLLSSEVLLASAAQRKENLVACLPDVAYFTIGSDANESTITASSVIGDLDDDNTFYTEGNGWLVVRPADPGAATAERLDRKAFAKLLQTGQKSGTLTIDDYANYALASGMDEAGWTQSLAEIVLRKESIPACGNDWHLLKLYASLTPPQMESLRKGGKLSFRDLSASQAEWIVQSLVSRTKGDFLMMRMMSQTGEEADPTRDWTDLMMEPTELLAKPLDSNGWIDLEAGSEMRLDLEYLDGDGDHVSEGSSIESLAMRFYIKKHPELRDPEESETVIDRVKFHTDFDLTFSFHLAAKVVLAGSLNDRVFESPKGYALDRLPDSVMKQIAELFKKFDEQVKNGELAPPPPPPQS
jgi:hypothetical protein